MKGLESLGVHTAMRNNPTIMRPLFVGGMLDLTAEAVEQCLIIPAEAWSTAWSIYFLNVNPVFSPPADRPRAIGLRRRRRRAAGRDTSGTWQ